MKCRKSLERYITASEAPMHIVRKKWYHRKQKGEIRAVRYLLFRSFLISLVLRYAHEQCTTRAEKAPMKLATLQNVDRFAAHKKKLVLEASQRRTRIATLLSCFPGTYVTWKARALSSPKLDMRKRHNKDNTHSTHILVVHFDRGDGHPGVERRRHLFLSGGLLCGHHDLLSVARWRITPRRVRPLS